MRSAACFVLLVSLSAQDRDHRPGALLRAVQETLEERLVLREFRRAELPALVREFVGPCGAAGSLGEEALLIDALLRRVPVSHLGLLSEHGYQLLRADLEARPRRQFGCVLRQLGARFFVDEVRPGGAADRAGLRRGDQVLALGGRVPARSPFLDRRSDDAWLDDPPKHALRVPESGRLAVSVASAQGGEARAVVLAAQRESITAAELRGTRLIRREGVVLGYLPLYLVHQIGRAHV